MNEQDDSPDHRELGSLHRGPANPPMDRLPPPAFPPGQRRDRVHRPRVSPEQNPRGLGFPEEAFFSPDDPIRRPRAMVPGGLHTWPGGPLEEEGGEEARSFDLLQVSHPTPTPKEIAGLLDRLAEEVRNLDGERFGWKAGAAPLEAALRGVLSAYLRQGRGG